MFRARRAHHQERHIVSIQPLATVILCWWPRCVQVGIRLNKLAASLDNTPKNEIASTPAVVVSVLCCLYVFVGFRTYAGLLNTYLSPGT